MRSLKNFLKQSVEIFLTPAEDPRQSFPDASTRQRNLLTQVDQAMIEIRTLSHQLESRKTMLESNLSTLMDKARQALQSGREDLARLALHRRKTLINEIKILDQQLQGAQKEDERLQIVRQKLETQIEAIKTRQQVLSARYSAAEAQVRLNESLHGISESFSDLGMSLEEAEYKTSVMQSRASAMQNLFDLNSFNMKNLGDIDQLTDQLNQLDDSQIIEDQLVAIKKELDPQK